MEGIMDSTRVRIMTRIKERLGFVLSSPILRYFWSAVTEYVPLNHSHSNFCSTDGDFSLYQQTFLCDQDFTGSGNSVQLQSFRASKYHYQ